MKNRLLRFVVTLSCLGALVVTPALPSTASAVTCGFDPYYGTVMTTNASFTQQATMDECDNGYVRVGVWVTPQAGYGGSRIIGCTAHLWLADGTAGTASDQTVPCDLEKARSGRRFSVGPSAWRVPVDHLVRGEAWVNIQTSCCYYNTYNRRSKVP